MPSRRRYRMTDRARQMDETRRRITETAVELHEEVGPSETTVAEIARRAGVQRATIYRHFPDEAALLAACSDHWLQRHTPPDPARWTSIADPEERTRTALRELYGYYRKTEPMTGNVLRDAARIPALAELLQTSLVPFLDGVSALLADAWSTAEDGDGPAWERATLRHAAEFTTWRSLTTQEGIDDRAAVELVITWLHGVRRASAPAHRGLPGETQG